MACEEDRKMIASWKEEAGQVFLFVRVCLLYSALSYSRTIDGFICCCRRDFDHGLNSRHSSKPTGHLSLLPREYPARTY